MTPFQKSNFGFVKSATGQERNFYPVKVWDFMSTMALFPQAWNGVANDLSQPPYPFNPPGSSNTLWIVPQLKHGFNGTQDYRVITTINTYNYGRVETTLSTYFPWFLNPMNPTPGASGNMSNPDYTSSYAAPGTYNPAQDLRLTGFPTTVEYLTENWSNGVKLTLISGSGGTGSYFQDPVSLKYYYADGEGFPTNQDGLPPPTVTETSTTQYYDDGTGGGAYDGSAPDAGHAIHIRIVQSQVVVSEEIDIAALCLTLLDSAPALFPQTKFTGREGQMYFDYFGTSSTYKNLTNYAAGHTYAIDGTCAITIPAQTILGISPGANEASQTDMAAIIGIVDGFTPTLIGASFNESWAYYFDPSGVERPLCSQVKIPYWVGGASQANGATGSYPNCFTFCAKNPSITLQGGGWQGLTQWSSGMTPAVEDIITQVNDGSTTFAFYKMQCSGTTGDGTAGSSEPNWNSVAVGGTITDNNVTWTLLAKGAPVTAVITLTHTNRVCLFPLNTGTIVTAQGDDGIAPGFYPAMNNCPNQIDGQHPPGFPDGFVCSSSLIRVPKNPDAAVQDVAEFSDIMHGASFPDRYLLIAMATAFDANNEPDYYQHSAVALVEILNTGEVLLTAAAVKSFSPTGFGWYYFGQPGDITYNPPTGGAGNGGGIDNAQGVGGSQQDSQGI